MGFCLWKFSAAREQRKENSDDEEQGFGHWGCAIGEYRHGVSPDQPARRRRSISRSRRGAWRGCLTQWRASRTGRRSGAGPWRSRGERKGQGSAGPRKGEGTGGQKQGRDRTRSGKGQGSAGRSTRSGKGQGSEGREGQGRGRTARPAGTD